MEHSESSYSEPAFSEKPRYIYEHEVFGRARDQQAELNLMRFDTIDDAVTRARMAANELDTFAIEEGLMDKPATILGGDVIVPVTYYDYAIGSVHITMERAGSVQGAIPDTHGEFFGFTGYTVKVENDRFCPMIAYSVKLRNLNATNIHGILLASGPVESTIVSFLDDELDQHLSSAPENPPKEP